METTRCKICGKETKNIGTSVCNDMACIQKAGDICEKKNKLEIENRLNQKHTCRKCSQTYTMREFGFDEPTILICLPCFQDQEREESIIHFHKGFFSMKD